MSQTSQKSVAPPAGQIVLRSLLIGLLRRKAFGMDIKQVSANVDEFMKDNPQIQVVERK